MSIIIRRGRTVVLLLLLMAIGLTVFSPSTASAQANASPAQSGIVAQIDVPCLVPGHPVLGIGCGDLIPDLLPDDVLPDVVDAILPDWNPFAWVNDQIHDQTQEYVDFLEEILINPIRPGPGEWQQTLYGRSLGIAPYIAYLGAMVLIVLAAILHKLVNPAIRMVIVFVIIGILVPLWYPFTNEILELRDRITPTAQFYDAPDANSSEGALLFLPDIVNIIGSLISFTIILGLSFVLTVIIYLFEVLVIVAFWLFLPALAVMPLGGLGRRLFSWVVSAITAFVFVGWLVVFVMEVGQLMSDVVPKGDTPIGVGLVTIGSLTASIIAAKSLWGATKQNVTRVVGNLATTSVIPRGKIEASLARNQKVGVNSSSSLALVPIPIKSYQHPRVNKARIDAAKKSSGMLAAKAASSGHPLLAVAVKGAGKAAGHTRKKKG